MSSKALLFIDLLGFSEMVSNDSEKAKNILSDFYNICYDLINNDTTIKGNLFSDSLLAYSSNPSALANMACTIYRKCLKKNKYYHEDLNYDLSKFFLLPRGGISFGLVDVQDREEASNLQKNFIVSPALVHSAKMESKIKGSRLLIAEPLDKRVFNWNENINSVLYENSSFIFWEDFKYFDSLWFLDLQGEEQEEIEELINIAKILVFNNFDKISNLEQHIQTLRIGLLSFSKFLNSQDISFIEQLINQFTDEKYWLVWLTIFEMIGYNSDAVLILQNRKVIDFYKRISISKNWSKVINEINLPNNEKLKEIFSVLLNHIVHRGI